ncbi:MAG: DNA-binding protein [Gammaproteobacteria bacterium]|nr:Arc family DNA-binding protein [Gammaproteobacteria bacterium]PCH64246.1 MAG: DNA-binding protein [Gammaproteobacteria bacterium]
MSEAHKRYPSELAPKFVLRFPQGMREEIREIATNNHRSMTAEIIARLEKSMLVDGLPTGSVNTVQEPLTEAYINVLSSSDQQLVSLFRQLPEDKRRALIALLS